MINKIINYCWFGGGELPDSYKRYMSTWKEKCPDFEIVRWDESNFDIHCCAYVEEAYRKKKYAFVADYARLYALKENGGIYLDTDIEILRNFDDLLDCAAFFSFGKNGHLSVPVFGSEKGFELLDEILEIYNNKRFIQDNGDLDTTTIEKNVGIILDKYGLKRNGKLQTIEYNDEKNIVVYSPDYFYSTDYMTGLIYRNPNLYIIHYCEASWVEKEYKQRLEYQHRACKLLGAKLGVPVGSFFYFLKKDGLKITFVHIGDYFKRKKID